MEHWHNALNQGAVAARNMIGVTTAYDKIHLVLVRPVRLQPAICGFHREWDDLVVRANLEERDFIAFYVKDGVIAAAVGINRGRDIRRAMQLIQGESSR